MSGKTNTIGRRPKRGTVTKASARGVKVSKAKTPRPDKRTTAGRKRQAKQSKRDRVARASARPVDVDTRRELSATEQARMEHLVAALRATHDKAMRLLGVDGDAPERSPDPRPTMLARGLYFLAVRAAGFRIGDYAVRGERDRCIVPEFRTFSSWSQVHYLVANTDAWLSAARKAPVADACRAVLDVLTAFAAGKVAAAERKFGPRPGAKNKPSAAPVRARQVAKKVARRKAAKVNTSRVGPAPTPPTPAPPAEAEQVPMEFTLPNVTRLGGGPIVVQEPS